jgi:mRNA interferase MazF
MFGEVYLCRFPFTSGTDSKVRPALVLFDLGQDAIVCRVTSLVRDGLLDVTLKDWKSAGLLLPSVARLDRIITAERSVFLRQLGMLSRADLSVIRSIWNQHMVL